MKNKFLNSIGLAMLLNMACVAAVTSQTNSADGKTDQKEQLEKRNENNTARSRDQHGDNSTGFRRDSSKPHFGGKQNFQGRSNRGNSFQRQSHGPQNFRDSYMYREGFKAGQYSQGFRERSMRNNFNGGQRFGRNGFGGSHFQHKGGMNRGMGANNPEIKALKEQIWKDGVMDLKERDQLQAKMKSFRSQRQGNPNQDKKENLQKSPDKNK